MFQANQSFAGLITVVPALENLSWLYGLILACLVVLVIIGGIHRIGVVAEILIPMMCLIIREFGIRKGLRR